MASTNFTIPLDKAALLEQGDGYFVRAVYDISEMSAKLKQARERLQKESFEFIFEAFPVYYSVIHHEESLRFDIIKRAFADLHTALRNFNDALGSALEDKDSLNDELKSKYLNLIKMLLYIYVQVVTLLERVGALSNRASLLPAKTKSKDTVFMNKTSIIELISNIAEKPINLLWEPPVVEETFVNLLSEIIYSFILNPSIESDKDFKVIIFNLIARLINNYNHGAVFVRMSVKMVKSNVHLALCISEGVHQLVKNLNCKESLVHDLVKEATEWQIEEQFQDCNGAWYCSIFVSEMAELMPDLMSTEVLYLSKYLAHNAVPLKNAVLTVIAKVLAKHSDDHSKEYRNQLLVTLIEHLNDISDPVRGKCFQLLATIHVEGVEGLIPLKHQHIILKEAIRHLQEKKPNVRRFAANCITRILSKNPYGVNLRPEEAQREISRLQSLLNEILDHISHSKKFKRNEIEIMWNLMVTLGTLKPSIEKELEKDPDPADTEIPREEVYNLIREYMIQGECLEAFRLCRTYFGKFETFRKIKDEMKEAKEVDLFLAVMGDIFIGLNTPLDSEVVSTDIFRGLQAIKEGITPYRDFVTFVDLTESAVKPMVELLNTTEMSDLTEAIEFFVFAYRFNVRNVYDGILAMLKLLKKPDQERKCVLIEVLKTILLNTDKSIVEEHAATVVNRLIALLNKVPEANIGDLQALIAEWTAMGTLRDVMIDKLWQYFSQKVPVTQSVSRSALILLRMAALGSGAIIGTNIKVVADEAFSQRAVEDALFMSACFDFLQVAGIRKVGMKSLAFKIVNKDPIFTNLLRFLAEEFFVSKMHFSKVIVSAIDLIYRTSSKPEKLCEEIMTTVIAAVAAYVTENGEREVQMFVLTRICVLLRAISLWQTKVLGHEDYRDLKRRKIKRDNKPIIKKYRHSASEGSSISGESLPIQTSNEEFEIKGALVEDEDAEFILNILEKDTVTGSGGLSKLARIVVNICQRPNRYNEEVIQDNAVVSLLQYMMISSEFCDDHLKVLLTLLEESKFPLVKITIIRRIDLLQRYPHIVDPWMDAMINRLKDQNMKVRRCAFSSLSRLIMEDSIWVRDMTHVCSRISALVRCIVSEDSQLRSLSKNLFLQLAERDSNLVYNILPDVWSDLAESGDMKEEDLKTIMKFLFYLIEKIKHMENLVDCFCEKFCESKYHHLCANISYCLSLIKYNKKALNKLLDNFDNYKPFLDVPDVHNNFQQILKACSENQTAKTDMEPIVLELENQIQSVLKKVSQDPSKRCPASEECSINQETVKVKQQPPKGKQRRGQARQKADQAKRQTVGDQEQTVQVKQKADQAKQQTVGDKEQTVQVEQKADQAKQQTVGDKEQTVQVEQRADQAKQTVGDKEQTVQVKQMADQAKQQTVGDKEQTVQVKEMADQAKQQTVGDKEQTIQVKQMADQAKQLTVGDKEQTVQVKQMADQAKQQTVGDKEQTVQVKQMADQAKQQTVGDKEQTVQVKQMADQAKQQTVGDKEQTVQVKQMTDQAKQQTVGDKEQTVQVKRMADQAKQQTVGDKEQTVQVKQMADQAKQQTVGDKEQTVQVKQNADQAKRQTVGDKKQTVQVKQNADQAKRQIVGDKKQTVQVKQNADQAKRQTVGDKKQTVQVKQKADQAKRQTVGDKEQTVQVKQKADQAKRQTVGDKKQTVQVKQMADQAKQQTVGNKEQTVQVKEMADQAKQQTVGDKEQTVQVKHQVGQDKQQHNQAPLHDQKWMVVDRLYPLIQQMYPDLAGKITSMLLKDDNSKLLHMLEHKESLKAKVEEAVAELQLQDKQQLGKAKKKPGDRAKQQHGRVHEKHRRVFGRAKQQTHQGKQQIAQAEEQTDQAQQEIPQTEQVTVPFEGKVDTETPIDYCYTDYCYDDDHWQLWKLAKKAESESQTDPWDGKVDTETPRYFCYGADHLQRWKLAKKAESESQTDPCDGKGDAVKKLHAYLKKQKHDRAKKQARRSRRAEQQADRALPQDVEQVVNERLLPEAVAFHFENYEQVNKMRSELESLKAKVEEVVGLYQDVQAYQAKQQPGPTKEPTDQAKELMDRIREQTDQVRELIVQGKKTADETKQMVDQAIAEAKEQIHGKKPWSTWEPGQASPQEQEQVLGEHLFSMLWLMENDMNGQLLVILLEAESLNAELGKVDAVLPDLLVHQARRGF